jgi:hypothetical protein
MDQRDAHEVGALLRRARDLAGAALERLDEVVPALLALEDRDPRVEGGQIARIAVDATLPQRQRAIRIAERLRASPPR